MQCSAVGRRQASVRLSHKNRGKQRTDIVTSFPKPHSPNEKQFMQSLSAIIPTLEYTSLVYVPIHFFSFLYFENLRWAQSRVNGQLARAPSSAEIRMKLVGTAGLRTSSASVKN